MSNFSRNQMPAAALGHPLLAEHKSVLIGPENTTMLHQIQPLEDSRWDALLKHHPSASLFHSVEWLHALRRTYGYEPVAYTTSPPGTELRNGIVFCRVDSRLTGHRLVSLPFSDHCEPLLDDAADLRDFLLAMPQILQDEKVSYIEVRPLHTLAGITSVCQSTCTYYSHQLDLAPDLNTLFDRFHKDSIQRKIRRAERGRLRYEEGRSESLLSVFWCLFLFTRRRHGAPPQPRRWFRALIESFGENLKIRAAFDGTHPVAAILTIAYKDSLVYKYGSSDARFHNLGGVPFLLWRAIQEAKQKGLHCFDFGRSDVDNSGLISFKDRWGTTRSMLTYSRFTGPIGSSATFHPLAGWPVKVTKYMVSHLPDSLFSMVGTVFYRHIG